MIRSALIPILLLLAACGGPDPATAPVGDAGHHHRGHDPAAAEAAIVSLDLVAADGRAHLLLGRRQDDALVLSYRHSADGERWSEPRPVDLGAAPASPTLRPGNDAQLAVRGETLVVAWCSAGEGWGGSGPLAVAVSPDGGRSWTPGSGPADTGGRGGEGFADLAFAPDGTLHAVWLDQRDGSQGLRHATSRDAGRSWSANRSVDAATCECCWNALAIDADGVARVLYRDREPRDMALAGLAPGAERWSEAVPVGAYDWDFAGCPHVGGGIARSGEGTLHAAVWSGAPGHAGVHVLASIDGGPWTSQRGFVVDGTLPRIAAAPAGEAVAAVWVQRGPNASQVVARSSSDAGRSWSAPIVLSDDGSAATHPHLVALGDGFVVLWRAGDSTWRSRFVAVAPE